MKRYIAPILVLALLLAAGGSLRSFSRPAPAAEQPPQTVSEEQPEPAAPAEIPDSGSSNPEPAAEAAPAESAPEESAPADEAPANPAPVPDAPSPSAAPEPAGNTPPVEAPPVKPESVPNPPPSAGPEQPAETPAAPAADLSALAQDLLDAINAERAGAGVPLLTPDASLSAVAGLRAEECTVQFSHTRPNGSSYYSAVDSAGIAYQYLGENLATGYSSARSVIQGWNDSDPHHDNIVNKNFTSVGIGLAENSGNPYSGYAWVVIFWG